MSNPQAKPPTGPRVSSPTLRAHFSLPLLPLPQTALSLEHQNQVAPTMSGGVRPPRPPSLGAPCQHVVRQGPTARTRCAPAAAAAVWRASPAPLPVGPAGCEGWAPSHRPAREQRPPRAATYAGYTTAEPSATGGHVPAAAWPPTTCSPPTAAAPAHGQPPRPAATTPRPARATGWRPPK